jgi:hypothetical protein
MSGLVVETYAVVGCEKPVFDSRSNHDPQHVLIEVRRI